MHSTSNATNIDSNIYKTAKTLRINIIRAAGNDITALNWLEAALDGAGIAGSNVVTAARANEGKLLAWLTR